MALKVVGAGFGRTGTLSMKMALEQLGFGPCYHMFEVFEHGHMHMWQEIADGGAPDWDMVFDGYAATVDWPACNFYADLAVRYPEAKILLTRRPAEDWYRSCINTIFVGMINGPAPDAPDESKAMMRMVTTLIAENTFGGDLTDKENAIRVYEAHNQQVIDTVPADRLLVYETGEGWARLCDFLGVPVPDTPFPKSNTTQEFKERIAARSQSA